MIHLNFDSFNLELGPNWIEALHDRWRLTIPCRSDARPMPVRPASAAPNLRMHQSAHHRTSCWSFKQVWLERGEAGRPLCSQITCWLPFLFLLALHYIPSIVVRRLSCKTSRANTQCTCVIIRFNPICLFFHKLWCGLSRCDLGGRPKKKVDMTWTVTF